jgi:hypothetical protein
MQPLLTRDEFREGVFKRDNYTCVFCSEPAKDAHHLIERRLWEDGGYYLNNGISVCEKHHLLCETTDISVEDARIAAGITKPIVPPHLYDDMVLDKWGNVILPNGSRLKGELFDDESVQKILKDKLDLFTDYVKYPRTLHLPWSEGVGKDDRVLKDVSIFEGREVEVTEKMDGENTSIYKDYIHARSLDGRNHPSRNWVKNYANTFNYELPKGWRVCGENLYAKHSIGYEDLPSYFLAFSMWDDRNVCLSCKDMDDWFTLLGLHKVKVLYKGIFDEKIIRGLWNEKNRESIEGYVLRLTEEFSYANFRHSVAKFVRKNHVHTHGHWTQQIIVPNKLKNA